MTDMQIGYLLRRDAAHWANYGRPAPNMRRELRATPSDSLQCTMGRLFPSAVGPHPLESLGIYELLCVLNVAHMTALSRSRLGELWSAFRTSASPHRILSICIASRDRATLHMDREANWNFGA